MKFFEMSSNYVTKQNALLQKKIHKHASKTFQLLTQKFNKVINPLFISRRHSLNCFSVN